MATSKDFPIIDLGQDITYIISQDESSRDNLQHYFRTINMDDLIGYTCAN